MSVSPLRVWAGSVPSVDINDRAARLALSPILRARLDDRFEDAALAERYGSLRTSYQLTDLEDAEVALLPRVFEHTEEAELRSVMRAAESRGLRTLVFAGHDLEPVMPSESIILLHPGPTRGAQPRADVLALPYLFTDRTRPGEPSRPDGDRPSVAFCGQGAARRGAAVAHMARRALDAAANRMRPRVIPPPVRGHVGLRSTALRTLSEHPAVDHRFVIRDQYRAGASGEADRARTQAEFDDNLRAATYALCVRGTGNFSARFYEALSFGRVPLFVDTDCVLPLEDDIDWRARVVWLDEQDVSSIGDRLIEEHPRVMVDRHRSASALRELWQQHLTQDGFFSQLPRVIRRLL